MQRKTGLVLSGGGARGAYQVGVMAAVSDILKSSGIEFKFDYYSGVSAGAINASFLASKSDDLHSGCSQLVNLWKDLKSEDVFYTDAVNLGKIGLKWMGELSLGALTGTTPGRALLDTSPLRGLLEANLDYQAIERNLKEKHYSALAITAVDYQTSNSITFVQGRNDLPTWNKARKISEKADIRAEHILASSAIPLLFPPVQVDERWFGDGCVRNTHPCAPVIYMGAEKLMVIGVRQVGMSAYEERVLKSTLSPSVARVINVLLNAVLLDGIELDIERLIRVNNFIAKVPAEHRKELTYKPVDYFWISPSADIGEMAARKSSRLPRVIRYLIKGLGSLEEASEIVSYLLFDPSFCGQLIELGYEDAKKQEEEIKRFYSSP
jgi:NTE family protein